jgi:hypothetical protein
MAVGCRISVGSLMPELSAGRCLNRTRTRPATVVRPLGPSTELTSQAVTATRRPTRPEADARRRPRGIVRDLSVRDVSVETPGWG